MIHYHHCFVTQKHNHLFRHHSGRLSLFLICFYAKAQSVSAKTGKEAKVNLSANFSALTLNAYQDASKNIIEDFYQYFQLLADTSASLSLKKEITESIYLRYKNRNTFVSDFTLSGNQKIELSLLINKILSLPALTIELEKLSLNSAISGDSWVVNYNLKVNNGQETVTHKLAQTVFLTQQIKAFGTKKKNVWAMLLGEIN